MDGAAISGKFFYNLSILEDLRAQYRKLVMIHHPDKGGKTEDMQALNAEYSRFLAFFESNAPEWRDALNERQETQAEKQEKAVQRERRKQAQDKISWHCTPEQLERMNCGDRENVDLFFEEKEIFEKDKNVVCRYGRKEDILPFCDRLSEQLDLALAMASENEKKRIEMLYVGVRWYKLFNIMDDVMETGTEEEKQAIMKENEKLYQGMKLYCMKYTIFAGMDIEKMYLDFSISPTKWNYWARDVIKFPFKNILKE